ncbi:MAG: metal ABC transporter permease [candidate division WOR-3 bacterium]
MVEALGYGFMLRALVGSLLVGTACSLVGVYVVLRGMAFLGDGLAHASFGGVTLGFLLGINPLFTAIIFTLATAGLVQLTSRRAQLRIDAAIGVFFSFTMALALVFLGLMRRYDARLYGFLFGNVLGISRENLVLMLILTSIVVLTLACLHQEFKFLTFDEELAQAQGLPTALLSGIMLGLIALCVVVSIKAVGIILVSALLVTPAATALQLTNRFSLMFLLSWIAGLVSCVLGMLLSYWLDIPSGASIVITLTLLFALATIFSPKRRTCRICARPPT